VGPPSAARWEWVPIEDLGAAVLADAAAVLGDIAEAAIARFAADPPPDMDLRIDALP
jgi:hypothetical protein